MMNKHTHNEDTEAYKNTLKNALDEIKSRSYDIVDANGKTKKCIEFDKACEILKDFLSKSQEKQNANKETKAR